MTVAQEFETSSRKNRVGPDLLRSLASLVCRRGSYSVTTLRDPEIGDFNMVAIQDRDDASRFSRAVEARPLARFGNWLTHSSFVGDARSKLRIDRYLGGR